MEKGYVYLICDSINDYYKIGRTKHNPADRLNGLKTGNGNELTLIDSYESDIYKIIEKQLHLRYKHLKVRLEWFDLPSEDVFNFIKTCESIEDTIKFLNEHNFYANKHLKL